MPRQALNGPSGRAEILNSGLAANLEIPHPIFIERGEGVYDADGNRNLDTSVGFGLHMLGHCHPDVEAASVHRDGIEPVRRLGCLNTGVTWI